MTPEKLAGLRALAEREDTPLEEARTAALAFVRGLRGAEASELEELRARIIELEGLLGRERETASQWMRAAEQWRARAERAEAEIRRPASPATELALWDGATFEKIVGGMEGDGGPWRRGC